MQSTGVGRMAEAAAEEKNVSLRHGEESSCER